MELTGNIAGKGSFPYYVLSDTFHFIENLDIFLEMLGIFHDCHCCFRMVGNVGAGIRSVGGVLSNGKIMSKN